jgi:branched-chain amino acid transport system substrate-binding protein
MKKRLVAAIMFCLVAAGILGAGAQQEESKIYVGLAVPLTGDSSMYGETVRNGVLFGVDEVNATGGINGKKIEIIAQDDKGNPKEAVLVAQKLAEDKRLFAVIGHVNSTCTIAALPIYAEAGLTVLNTSSSARRITELGYKNFFRTLMHDGLQGPATIVVAVEKLGHKRIACIVANNDYGLGLLNIVKERAESYRDRGVSIVAVETYMPGTDKDFSPQLTKINTANPDVLLVLGDYNEAGLIIRQMKTAGMNMDRVLASACSNPILVDLAGVEAAEGTYVVDTWDATNPRPEVQAFVQKFKAKYGRNPDQREAHGYEMPFIIKKAIVDYGATKENLSDVLRQLEFIGPTGLTKFNEEGDVPYKDHFVFIIKDGKFTSWVK